MIEKPFLAPARPRLGHCQRTWLGVEALTAYRERLDPCRLSAAAQTLVRCCAVRCEYEPSLDSRRRPATTLALSSCRLSSSCDSVTALSCAYSPLCPRPPSPPTDGFKAGFSLRATTAMRVRPTGQQRRLSSRPHTARASSEASSVLYRVFAEHYGLASGAACAVQVAVTIRHPPSTLFPILFPHLVVQIPITSPFTKADSFIACVQTTALALSLQSSESTSRRPPVCLSLWPAETVLYRLDRAASTASGSDRSTFMTTTHPQQPAQSASSASTRSQRKERQTRLQEHLRAVKPGSRSSSPNGGAGINSKQQAPLTTTTTSMGRSTSRKSTPSAKKAAAAAADPEPVQATTATGRPKRRAAKARVALADLQSSDDEAVGTTSKSGPAEATKADAPDPTEEEETSLASATPTRSTVGKARNQARQPVPLSRQPSIDDLAPSTTTTTTRTSVGRKSPAKQIQSAAAQRRKREASGGSASGQRSSSAQPSPSPYQTDPGLMQKHQFRSVLAQHGYVLSLSAPASSQPKNKN